ncbi:hypothetical protein P43SY_004443 [Pythium insidiosum]|uniref:HAT C-terminal dimerisation domain-containing protein n=1 Tax=Pythium insidiosum TaxID=114742 RepID=A0AAD5Q924_PYTIN|nr:hypothetical protein P43SY_004443 [Pythium insidiosum]
MSSPASSAGNAAQAAEDATLLTLQDLENTSRNSKKKLYWSAFEVVLSTTRVDAATQREELTETRLDAYHVNHHQLKKLHGSARSAGASATAVRVECKLCTTPRFTQSITVSTKKFEEHYMTHHALNALAAAERSKSSGESDAQHQQQQDAGKSSRDASAENEGADATGRSSADAHKDDALPRKSDPRGQTTAPQENSDDDGRIEIHAVEDAAPEDAAAEGSSPARDGASREAAAVAVVALSSAPGPARAKWTDPTESDTKRAKKSYWTAFEVVISERVARDGGVQVQETRQDAWRVNHNALRRLHLDERNQTTVRVECRLCTSPKYTQSITVSTKKFELHVLEEHAEDVAAGHSAAADESDSRGNSGATEAAARPVKKRRKSWRLMLQDHQQQLQRPQPVDAPSPKKPRVVVLPEAASTSTPAPATALLAPAPPPPAATAAAAPSERSTAAVLRWLVEDCLPLSIADSPAFHAMMRVPYSSHVLQAQLDAQFEQAKHQVQQLVRDERAAGTRFSLSLEQISMDSGAAALAVSVHFVSSQWQAPRHMLVACRQLPTPWQENAAAVAALLSSVLEELGLTSVVEAVTTANDELSEALDAIWPQPTERRSRRASPAMPSRLHCAASALSFVVKAGIESIASTLASHAAMKRWTSCFETLAATAGASDQSQPSQPASAGDALRLLTPFARAATDLSDAAFPSAAMVVTLFRHLRQSLEAALSDCDDDASAPTKIMAQAMQDALQSVFDRVVSPDALLACVLDPRIRYSSVDEATKTIVNSYMEARMREELKRGLDQDDCSQDSVMADASSASDAADTPATAASTPSLVEPKPTLFEELVTKTQAQGLVPEGTATSRPNSESAAPSPTDAGSTDDRRSSLSSSSDVSLLIIRREIDAYLMLKSEPFGTDVIAWWQQHTAMFPLLSRLARHVLGAVATAQRCDQLFSAAGEERSARRRAVGSIALLEQLLMCRERPAREAPSPAVSHDTIACIV